MDEVIVAKTQLKDVIPFCYSKQLCDPINTDKASLVMKLISNNH